MLLAICGGVYSNPWALRAFIDDARARGAQRLYCLGDLGGYGAEPEAVWSLLTAADVTTVGGNYDVAIGSGAEDCGCGYRDPRDNQYAQVMYDYTRRNTSPAFAAWMRELPTERREEHDGCQLHLVHGSTIGLNDFWWESLSSADHAHRVAASGADVIACTHSGLPWVRRFGHTLVVNVGVIGRPANDGDLRVWYALVDLSDGIATAQLIRLRYDWRSHAKALRNTELPAAFAVTAETGWWTTCLEILPPAERGRGRFHIYDSSVATLAERLGLPDGGWSGGDLDLPVRSLWGSPLMPNRIRHACSEAIPKLRAAARRLGYQVLPLRTAPSDASACAEVPRPELTLTAEGWFYRPDDLSQGTLLPPARSVAGVVAQLPEARAIATTRLLQHLLAVGLLHPPAYCVA